MCANRVWSCHARLHKRNWFWSFFYIVFVATATTNCVIFVEIYVQFGCNNNETRWNEMSILVYFIFTLNPNTRFGSRAFDTNQSRFVRFNFRVVTASATRKRERASEREKREKISASSTIHDVWWYNSPSYVIGASCMCNNENSR